MTSFILLFSEVSGAISFERRNLGEKIDDARNNLIDMHLIQSLKNEFSFDLPFYKQLLPQNDSKLHHNAYSHLILKFE